LSIKKQDVPTYIDDKIWTFETEIDETEDSPKILPYGSTQEL